jgi:hypothetical protein
MSFKRAVLIAINAQANVDEKLMTELLEYLVDNSW